MIPHEERTTHLAWMRTRLAVERTLAAWMRTAVSLIGFGFTIFQFFHRLDDMPGIAKARRPWLSEAMSLSLVAAGTLGLCIALFDYRAIVRYLWSDEFKDVAGPSRHRWTPTAGIAVLLFVIGLFALVSMLARTT